MMTSFWWNLEIFQKNVFLLYKALKDEQFTKSGEEKENIEREANKTWQGTERDLFVKSQ